MASAVATPLERRFGRIAGVTEITSTSSLGATHDHAPVRSRSRRRRAARDVQAAINAAGGELPAEPARRGPTLPQGEPGRLADPDPLAHVGRRCRSRRSSTPPTPSSRRRSRRSTGVGQVFVGGGQQPAVRVQVDPRALAGAGLEPRGRAHRARAARPSNQPKGALAGATQAHDDRAPTTSSSAPTRTSRVIVAYQNGARRAPRRRRATSSTTSRTTASPAGPTASAPVLHDHPPPARARTSSTTIERVKALLPELATSISPAIDDRGRASIARRPSAPRCTTSSRRWCISVVLVVAGGLRVPAHRARDRHPQRRRAALAGRHVRRDVPARLQPRQPVADGAHHLDRASSSTTPSWSPRTSRATSSRASRRSRPRSRAPSRSASPSSRSPSRCSRCSSPSCSWAASSAASSASSRSRSASPSPSRRSSRSRSRR